MGSYETLVLFLQLLLLFIQASTQILSRVSPGKVMLKCVGRHNLKLRNKSSLKQLNMSMKSFKLYIKVLNQLF